MIHENLKKEMIAAMRTKDTVRLGVIRGLLALFQSEMLAKAVNTDYADDEFAMALIKRSVKQRKDSIEQFDKGGRADLADAERAELTILEKYLPATMPREEIKKIAEAKKAELNITDKSKLGILVGAVMKATGGNADGADVKSLVEELFK